MLDFFHFPDLYKFIAYETILKFTPKVWKFQMCDTMWH